MTSFRPSARHNGGPPLETYQAGQSGWIKVRRSIRVHEVVGFGMQVAPADHDRRFCFSRAEAWIDMIMECRYADGSVMNGPRRMDIKAGQLVGAVSWLASRWNWTPKTVRAFLDRLEAHGMIEQSMPGVDPTADQDDPSPEHSSAGRKKGQQKGTQARIISVCNYPIYQFTEAAQGPAQGQDNGSPTASQGLAKGNTLRKEEEKNIDSVGVSADARGEEVDAQAKPFTTLCVPAPLAVTGPDIPAPPVAAAVEPPLREVEAEFSFRPSSIPPPSPTVHTSQAVAVDVPRDDETEVAPGVYLNCNTVRHRAFALDITGIAMQLVLANTGLSKIQATDVARDAAVAHALQWAAEIANGRFPRDVVPASPANFIRASVVRQLTQKGAGQDKSAYVSSGSTGGAESRTQRTMRMAAEVRETMKAKGVIQ